MFDLVFQDIKNDDRDSSDVFQEISAMEEKSELLLKATTSLEEAKKDGEILKHVEEIQNQDILDVAKTSKDVDASMNPENPCAKEMLISLPDDGKHETYMTL